ncbi:ATP-binding cassette sub-family G member 1-like [Macrosteles quadrilineatus]|uniref:ATP-binding cassette sub-family G member 1-like n=1 Tax=Macrosteles quadrilineatus TaxID=74068 RepID=UPI0023E1EE45|nr:ATP-binding cassette sub-family G member 1-like [Macrosteles quadrilineatus]XP_054264070.1 ATP-binding cassette sub-family G member 1-like [Macrosteles quadrilineatus]XP_054264071.1 ATP-binding cassette sub-family G member 1-like [Macrosteles quadrilineatus]XP_054264072.1 ATP-binding cassette sub-family G member 1-like [Macrosteles quadrilineatus]
MAGDADAGFLPSADAKVQIVRCNTKMMHLPRSKPVDVIFEDVRLTVNTGFLYSKRSKEVLKGVSGRFVSGELTAIMGPSGSGKSTLLNILTGFQKEGMKGNISCASRLRKNGTTKLIPLNRKDCCYIMQDDNLTPLLTVKEIMLIASELKLDQSMSRKAKVILIEDILENVGLSLTMNTKCNRLSGGQRKRLSVALELINNPPVMFLDEPTTGLDSRSTLQIVTLLKNLAQGGRNIICTVHQPSATILAMFDHVYIIGNGYCVYQGSANNMLPFLQSIGLPCPQYHNPSDFMLDVVSGEFGDHTQQLVDNATNSIWRAPPIKQKEADIVEGDIPVNHQNPPSEFYRFRILVRKTIKLMFRDWTVVYLKLILHVVVGLMIGALFQKCGMDGDKSISNVGYFICSAVYLSYTSLMPAILKFPSELNVIKKEQFNHWYKLRTFYIAFQITNIPMQMIFCVIYVGISYYLTSQILERDRFLMFLVVNAFVIVISECMGLGLGTSINPVNGIFLGAVGICFMILMAGFLALLKDMPRILYYAAYVSYLRYALEAMVVAIYGYGRRNLYCEQNYCHYRSPAAVMTELDMVYGDYWRDISMLSIIAVVSILYAYYSLRSKMRW